MRLLPINHSPAVRAEIQPGIWLDSRLAVWFDAYRLLAVADLHWGYAASHHSRGNLLPAWGDDEIEARLRSLVNEYCPQEMIWLGDVVHAAEGGKHAEAFLRDPGAKTTVLAGNHDRYWHRVTERTAVRGTHFFHHGDCCEDIARGQTEIIGHHHPAVAWHDGAGGNVKVPALVASASRMILPAFSPWAAGTDCRSLGGSGATIWAITPKRIFAWSARAPAPAPS